MRRKGLTLIELLVTLIMIGLIITVMTCQFVAEQKFSNMISDQLSAGSEASIAMHNMTRVLRFAIKDGSLYASGPWDPWSDLITATIKGGYLPEIPDNTVVGFERVYKASPIVPGMLSNTINSITYNIRYGNTDHFSIIARNITEFRATVDPVTYKITLKITATVNSRSSSLETAVYPLN